MVILNDKTVFPDSQEWKILEVLLQLHLRTSRIKLLHASDVSLPETVASFNAKSTNHLISHTLIDINSLDANNTIQDIYRRGIKVPSQGMEVTIGNLNFPVLPIIDNVAEINEKVLVPPQKQSYQFVVCDVCLSLSATSEEDAARSRLTMASEYESHQIERGEAESKNVTVSFLPGGPVKGALPPSRLYEKFIIYDSSQILARYILKFEFDATAPESFALPFCEICHELPATIYCSSDKAKLCRDCDLSFHADNKFVARHIRVPLNQIPKTNMGFCHIHSKEEAKHYCLLCTTPFCDSCLIDHRHNNKLDVVPTTEAYNTILQDSRIEELLVNSYNDTRAQLKEIEELIQVVNRGRRESEEELYKEMENPIKRLEEIIEDKARLVLAQQNCLHTRHLQISWANEFISHMKNTLSPADFLPMWLAYSRYKKELLERPIPNKNVYADTKLVGSIKIALKQN